jgi:hypothetical protein
MLLVAFLTGQTAEARDRLKAMVVDTGEEIPGPLVTVCTGIIDEACHLADAYTPLGAPDVSVLFTDQADTEDHMEASWQEAVQLLVQRYSTHGLPGAWRTHAQMAAGTYGVPVEVMMYLIRVTAQALDLIGEQLPAADGRHTFAMTGLGYPRPRPVDPDDTADLILRVCQTLDSPTG